VNDTSLRTLEIKGRKIVVSIDGGRIRICTRRARRSGHDTRRRLCLSCSPFGGNHSKSWAETKNAPLLEAKKAVLWAELGEFEKAKEIIGSALETVRTQLNATLPDKKIVLLSQEGCSLSIYCPGG